MRSALKDKRSAREDLRTRGQHVRTGCHVVSTRDQDWRTRVQQVRTIYQDLKSRDQDQYVVFAHWMLGCPVGYVERGGGLYLP